jgi:hypothetical protein
LAIRRLDTFANDKKFRSAELELSTVKVHGKKKVELSLKQAVEAYRVVRC